MSQFDPEDDEVSEETPYEGPPDYPKSLYGNVGGTAVQDDLT